MVKGKEEQFGFRQVQTKVMIQIALHAQEYGGGEGTTQTRGVEGLWAQRVSERRTN